MDLFTIDKSILAFFYNLFHDSYTQFITLVGIFIISEIVLPTKKANK
jgi:hypothetical protein